LVRVADAHPLADNALHAQKAHTQLVLDQFAHGLHAAVAQMVDIIRIFHAIVDLDDALHDVHHIALGERSEADAQLCAQPAIELVAAHLAQIVPPRVEKQGLQIALGVVQGGRIARTHLLVEFLQRLLGGARRIVLDGGLDIQVLRHIVHRFKEAQEFLIRPHLQRQVVDAIGYGGHRPQKHRHGYLALAVHLHRDNIPSARLELQPGPAIGNQLGHAELPARRAVLVDSEIRAWRADELAHHHALGPIDDECPILRHDREIAHVHILHHGLVRFPVIEQNLDIQGRRIRRIALPTLVLGIGGLCKAIVEAKLLIQLFVETGKVQFQALVKANNGRDLAQQLSQTLILEPVVRFQLHLDEIGNRQHVSDAGIGFAVLAHCGLVRYHRHHSRSYHMLSLSFREHGLEPDASQGQLIWRDIP